jgi:hypothetical protein
MSLTVFTCFALIICFIAIPNGASAACVSLSNPYGSRPKNTKSNVWNPRKKFVVGRMKQCLSATYSCSTYASDSTSDHPGNAADCFPGRAGVMATGINRLNGDRLAAWAIKNAVPLKIN